MAQFGYTSEYNSLMEMAGILSNEQFSTFLNDVVFPYMSEGSIRDTLGFRVLPLKPAFEMTYAALQQTNKVQIMAKHVDVEAHAIPTPTQGAEILEGSIPAVATNTTMGMEDYLKAAKIIHYAQLAGQSLNSAVEDVLIENFEKKIAEHNARASYMRDYVVFHGKYEITERNNAGSYSNITFDFGVPSANKKELSGNNKWWTDDTFTIEGSAADPIKDLDDAILKLMAKGYKKSQICIEIGLMTMVALGRHSKVREAIAVFVNPSIAPRTASQSPSLAATTYGQSDEWLKAQLSARLGVEFIVRDFITGIPVLNKKTGNYNVANQSGFEEGTIVVRPKGEIGEVHGTSHILVGGSGDSVHSHGLLDGGRILFDYNCNVREKVQIWDTKEISLYVLTQGQNMFYLNVI